MTASLLETPKNRFVVLAAFVRHAFSSSYDGEIALRDEAFRQMREAAALLDNPREKFVAQEQIVSFYPEERSLTLEEKQDRRDAVQIMYAACCDIEDPTLRLQLFSYVAHKEPVPASIKDEVFETLCQSLADLPPHEGSLGLGLRLLVNTPRTLPQHDKIIEGLGAIAENSDTATSYNSVHLYKQIVQHTKNLRKTFPDNPAYDKPIVAMYEAARRYPEGLAFDALSSFLEIVPNKHPLYVEALQDLIAASPAMNPKSHTAQKLHTTSLRVLCRLEESVAYSKDLYKPLSRTALSNALLLGPFLNNCPEYELQLYTYVANAAASDADIRRNAVMAMLRLGQKIEKINQEKPNEESVRRFPLKQAFFAYNTALHYIDPKDYLLEPVTRSYIALAARKEMFNPYPYPFFNELEYCLKDKKFTLLRGVASEALISQSSLLHRLNPFREVMANAAFARTFAQDYQKMVLETGTAEDKALLQQSRKLYHACKP